MLLDGYWKNDLKKFIRQLRFWSSHDSVLFHNFVGHKINQALLFSATVIRKIIDDEKEAKSYFEEKNKSKEYLKTLFYSVPIVEYKYIGEEKLFANSKCNIPDYDTENFIESKLDLDKVCNQFIHSYVWSLANFSSTRKVYGVLFVSDKFKKDGVYFLKIDDWIKAIQFIIDNSNI